MKGENRKIEIENQKLKNENQKLEIWRKRGLNIQKLKKEESLGNLKFKNKIKIRKS